MAAEGVADEIGVVLVQPHLARFQQAQVPAAGALPEDAFAGLVLRDDFMKCGAFGGAVFRMRVVVVEARAITEDEIALDLLKAERALLVDLVVGRLIRVLEQLRRSEAARVEVRVFEFVVPFHCRAVIRVAPDDLNRLLNHVHLFASVDGNAVFRFDPKYPFHWQSRIRAMRQ